MAPFTPSDSSQLVAEHPDWIADLTPLGELFVSEDNVLDLTHPEVLAWLDELLTTFRYEWGFDWLKLDFGYFALFGEGFAQPMTREQAWRGAMQTIRDALGEDAFFLVVGTVGMNYGIVDAGRTTLDNMPMWQWEPGVDWDDVWEQQGAKPTTRTAARRWMGSTSPSMWSGCWTGGRTGT